MQKLNRTIAILDRQPTAMQRGTDRNSDREKKLVSRRILILGNVLRRAAGLRYRRLLDLPAGEWGVIGELGYQAPRTLNDLSNGIGLDKTQLSRTVSRLVARGLVTRKTNPTNNREILISLTSPGRTCSKKILKAGLSVNETLLQGWSKQNVETFVLQIDNLTERARMNLLAEQKLGCPDDGKPS